MTVKTHEREISTKKALENIRERLYRAVEEGKRKAGVHVKTEAVFEGAEDSDDELDFSMMDSDDESVAGGGDELDFSQMSSDDSGAEAKQAALPKTFALSKPKKASREEELLSERRSRELKRQMDAENNFSVKEIKEIVTDLFKYAAENREYLKDAGPLITEDELWAIFHAEFNNYGSDTLKETTKDALKFVPDIFEKELPVFRERFDERLHGNGNFLENGSLMAYLLRIAYKRVLHPMDIDPSAPLVTGNMVSGDSSGLCNFVIASDLKQCEAWVQRLVGEYDMPESAKRGLALDILGHGLSNKPALRKKLGDRGSKEYAVPKYGSLEEIKGDLCVKGSEQFLDKFVTKFNAFLRAMDIQPDKDIRIEPAVDEHGNKDGRGLMMVRYPMTPYLKLINQAKDPADIDGGNLFVATKFNAGKTSLDTNKNESGGNQYKEDDSRRSDVLQTHSLRDPVESNDYSVGDKVSADELLQIFETPAFKKLIGRLGLEKLYAEAAGNNGTSIASLSKLSASVIESVCKEIGVKCDVLDVQSIHAVKPGTDKSIPAMAEERMGISPQERTALLAVIKFNGFMVDRVAEIKRGHDIGDIKGMNKYELRSETMPSIFTGKLAEACLSGKFDTPAVVDYAKGYMVHALGTVVGFENSKGQIFSSAADYCKMAGIPLITGSIIKREIESLNAGSIPAYADIFERKAEAGLDDEEESGNSFYNEGDSVELSDLEGNSVVKAVAEVVPDKVNAADVVKRAAEAVTGLEAGLLDKYEAALDSGDNEAVEAMAREIMKYGSGIVTVRLTDTGSERVKRNEAAAKKRAANAERRKARRMMWA
jgi:uncharacterized protein YbjQ (UPF0145 family)